MIVEAKYSSERSLDKDITTQSERQKKADKLVVTGTQKDKQIDEFISTEQKNYLSKKPKKESIRTNNLKITKTGTTKRKITNSNNNDIASHQIRNSYENKTNRLSKNKKRQQNIKVDELDDVLDNKASKTLKGKKLNVKSYAYKTGLSAVNILGKSEEFEDIDKATDKAASLRRAKEIAKKIKNKRRVAQAKRRSKTIKSAEKIVQAQQATAKAAASKAAAAGSAKAVAGTGGAAAAAGGAPILGILGVVVLIIVCVVAFATLLLSILSTTQKNNNGLTGVEREIANALMAQGYDKIHTAAIMGNMSAESGFNSKALQDVGDFENVPSGHRTSDNGYGLNQMTCGRKSNLCSTAEKNSKSHCDINSQVEYFCSGPEKAESNWNKALYSNYNTTPISRAQWEAETNDLALLTTTLMAFWERPSYDPSINHISFRISEANRIFAALNSTGDGTIVGEAMAIANDDSHGYSQSRRTMNPDVDCSSFVYYALKQAGYSVGDYPFNTYSMGGVLLGAGFKQIVFSDFGSCQPGDVLWNSGHTEIFTGGTKSVGGHWDHNHPEPGDQGHEVDEDESSGNRWQMIYRAPAK